jgi:hypothetical protein
MARRQLNPLHIVLRYMRGDDIKEANEAAVVQAQAALAGEEERVARGLRVDLLRPAATRVAQLPR